jgi:CYTH domain
MTDGGAPGESGGTPVETEAKLHGSRRAFADLSGLDEVAGWRVSARRDVNLRDAYWDTPDGRLARSGSTLRLREQRHRGSDQGSDQGGHQDDGLAAELTLKGPVPREAGSGPAAVWSRTELTVAAPPGSGPAEWAGIPAARPVMDALERMGALDGLRPDVVLRNPRRELVLERDGDQAVLSLDEVAVEGTPYRRRYVEVELTRGTPAAIDDLVETLLSRFRLRPSRRAKVQAARDWLARRRPAAGTRSVRAS